VVSEAGMQTLTSLLLDRALRPMSNGHGNRKDPVALRQSSGQLGCLTWIYEPKGYLLIPLSLPLQACSVVCLLVVLLLDFLQFT